MASGLFNLKNQLRGLIQKAWPRPLSSAGIYAGVFSGSNNLSLSANSAFAFGSNDYTVEMWVYSQGTGQQIPYCSGVTGTLNFYFNYNPSGGYIGIGTQAVFVLQATGLTINSNTWYHIAASRVSGTLKLFLNGTQVASGTDSTNWIQAGGPLIGQTGGGSLYYTGSITNLRVINGTGLYTSSFTPSTTPLTAVPNTVLLTLQNTIFTDTSANAFAITNTGGVTTQPTTLFTNNPLYTIPSVEYLVVAGGSSGGGGGSYAGGGGGAGGLLAGIASIAVGSSITVTVGGGGAGTSGLGNNGSNSVFGSITASGGGGGSYTQTDSGLNGGSGGGGGGGTSDTFHPYGNGIQGQGNSGGLGKYYASGGGGGAGTKGIDGAGTFIPCGNGGAGVASAISGAVVTYSGGGGGGSYVSQTTGNGIGGVGGGGTGAYYSSAAGTAGTVNTGGGGGGGNQNFVTSGAGGSGICIISYPDTYNAPTTLTGTYTASTSGSGSFAPLNTSSWIYYNAPSNLQFGTGDFTIELWVYFTSLSGTNYLIDFRGTSNPTGASFGMYQNSAGLQLFNNATTINYGMPSANTWYNVVWSRTSGVTYFFVNGTLVNSGGTTDTANYTAGTNGPSFAGSSYYGFSAGLNFGLQGYMSNLRVLKGTGLYTSNFTPSTKPLTAITNTSLLLNTVSGAYLADGSTNANAASVAGTVSWNQASPFATGLGYKNRVYTWTASGTVTF